jgi:hypothetical protein
LTPLSSFQILLETTHSIIKLFDGAPLSGNGGPSSKGLYGLRLHGKEQYIDHHLFNELRWLLNAATEWSIQRHLNLQICGYDIQVYAMDSAVLHARALFEFFVQAANVNHYGSDQFLGVSLKSDIYSHDWKDSRG